MSICTNILFLRILSFFQIILQIIRFAVPIGLIIKLGFDFYKNIVSGDYEKQKANNSMAVRRIVAAVVVFLIPTFINLLLFFVENLIGGDYDYQGCLANVDNIDYYIELELKNTELKERQEKEKLLAEYEKIKQDALELLQNNLSKNQNLGTSGDVYTSETAGNFVGKNYQLTESQLRDIAKVCQREQGSAKGAAWEASLMANRFELHGSKYGNIYNYVMNCRWWAPAKNGTYKSVDLKDSVLNAVRQVLVNGQRQLPIYVDEHDWTGDIEYIVTNGNKISGSSSVKNHNNFVKDQTHIYNKYGGHYIFYGYASTSSSADPFGYTPSAYKKVMSMNSTY